MTTESETFAAGDRHGLWAKTGTGTGPMKGHSRLEFEVSRVLGLAQNVPCFLVKAEKLGCCLMKSIRQQSNYKLDENNHLGICAAHTLSNMAGPGKKPVQVYRT
jgi:hypothetical protein